MTRTVTDPAAFKELKGPSELAFGPPVQHIDTSQVVVRAYPNVLAEAEAIVYNGDRQKDYGHPKEHFTRTVGLLNAAFTRKIVARLDAGEEPFKTEDWPIIMVLDKIARLMHKHKRDTVRDIAGYAATLERVLGEDE